MAAMLRQNVRWATYREYSINGEASKLSRGGVFHRAVEPTLASCAKMRHPSAQRRAHSR